MNELLIFDSSEVSLNPSRLVSLAGLLLDSDPAQWVSVANYAKPRSWRLILWQRVAAICGCGYRYIRSSGEIELYGSTARIAVAIKLQSKLELCVEAAADRYGSTIERNCARHAIINAI